MGYEIVESEISLEEAEAIDAEVDATEVNEDLLSSAESRLRKIIRRRGILADQVERIKREAALAVKQAEADLRKFDFRMMPEARQIAADLLLGRRERSIRTPYGTASFRKVPTRCYLEDEEALREAWSRQEVPGDLVTTETQWKYDRTAIQKHFQATGEVLPGCTVEQEHDSFSVK